MFLPSQAPRTHGEFVFVVAIALIPILYLTRQHKRFLLSGAVAFIFAAVTASVAALAWGIAYRLAFDRPHLAVAVGVSCPVLELMLFRLGFGFFKHRYGREPEDIGKKPVPPGRWPDVWFRVLVLVLLCIVPAGLLGFYFSDDLS